MENMSGNQPVQYQLSFYFPDNAFIYLLFPLD